MSNSIEQQDTFDITKGQSLWNECLERFPQKKQKWDVLHELLYKEPTQDRQTLSLIQDAKLQEGLVTLLVADVQGIISLHPDIPYQSRIRILHFLLQYASQQEFQGDIIQGVSALWQEQPSFLGLLYAHDCLNHLILDIARHVNMAHISSSIHPKLLDILTQMVEVLPGRYNIGANAGDMSAWDNEKPRHDVRISGFAIGRYPLTQGVYSWIQGEGNINSYSKDDPPAAFPVQKLTWHAALQFCNRFSSFMGFANAYEIRKIHNPQGQSHLQIGWKSGANGFRLPTEVEWEIAARANTRYLYSGSNRATDVAWCVNSAAGRVQGVGQLRPNDWGIYDMSGNVWEWCWDGYDSSAYAKRVQRMKQNPIPEPMLDPHVEASGTRAIARGGGAGCIHFDCRNSYRGQFHPNKVISLVGMRIVQSLLID